ncbi:hypothetical protein Tco_0295838 [Tanacetum coccineum]
MAMGRGDHPPSSNPISKPRPKPALIPNGDLIGALHWGEMLPQTRSDPRWRFLSGRLYERIAPPNTRYSLFDIIVDDVYTTFFDQLEYDKESSKTDVQESTKTYVQDVAKTDIQDVPPTSVVKIGQDVLECSKNKDQQEVTATDVIELDTEIILIDSNSSSDELEFLSSLKLEFPSSDELDSYSSSFDDSDESDSTSLSSLEKIVSNKGQSKDLQKWYEDEDEKDEEEDEKDDEDDELWTPKSKGTSSKCLPTKKRKGTSSKSNPTTKSKGKALSTPKIPQIKKNFVVKSTVPIRNCCIGLADKITWEMIVNKIFRVPDQDKEQTRKGKRKLGV